MLEMFYLLAVAVTIGLTSVTAADERPAHYEALLKLTQESLDGCFEDDANTIKVEFNDEGFEGLLVGTRDAPRSTKCLRYCIMRKNKLFNDEHQLNSNEMLEFFAKLYGNMVPTNALEDVVLHCKENASKEKDSCERAHTAAMCILGNLKERGYGQL